MRESETAETGDLRSRAALLICPRLNSRAPKILQLQGHSTA